VVDQTAFDFHPPQIFGGFDPPEYVGGLQHVSISQNTRISFPKTFQPPSLGFYSFLWDVTLEQRQSASMVIRRRPCHCLSVLVSVMKKQRSENP
jgi:hypothetical protein